MLPVVALVGRPNVGKSTLFNRLTNTRDALVADYPGLTRDRKYGQAKFEKRQFIVVDTGGITGDEEGIDAEMAQQSLLAIEEADVVLFLVDARAGLLPADQGIADHLRRINKQIFVVANKVDGIDGDSESAEFYSLGLGAIKQIAAAHGRGVSQLLQDALKPLESDFPDMEIIDEAPEEEEDAESQRQRLQELPIKLAIVGKPNVGKSTLTNRILGEERVVVYDMPGTTRDSVYIPMERDEREYILIDTAGVRKRKKISEAVEKFSIVKTLQAIEEANVVLLVIDAREGITDQDLSLLGFVLNSGRSLVVAVNKWDGLSTDIKDDIKREMDRRLGFIDFARIHFISALHGSGVGNLFESVQEAYMSATKRINTALLTQIMEMAQDDHQPPLVRGRRVKMKYAHAGGYNPPVIVIHGNQVDDLPSSYKRFLMNYFRKALEIMGTPIKIEFREGNNPFEGKKNNLTLAQQRKRRRMMSYYKEKK
ncbi:ribosome biogenesis GTPase Der [Alteromonas mediterranea]|jgi:GTPase|uniref:GTPase Der n=2 Tax=Alteromonas mediterranea TaxID=314275 RepID=DER_ALTMD|nr:MULTISPECIES: ribosome biogenesis GTPase Der [Alteromonas]B4RV85.1 RecName: Full=GTPase Der; AltName: Full=GTP-binding protein EngA [Alteromonas mediterranea DE]AGP94336.1 GTP-binding protein Der [Alteromonas mediterranea U8]MBR9895130.1 ribosome biogenesis GTPase Der [Gammaproteobacteria bacterium]MEA3380660.1 ribosome biogenesis GTPase Der [Pseudomonadota bacterium]AEA97193.1 GTP-binding protein Der [Alteromonas mediterranea DE]AFV86244.1 GTP-binding protein Der [Alteromonas mediterranea|tara:strand:+ start:3519 stop:4964 length:1446 start_codon:yes stop_codon:yes gene_type:complete